MVTTWPPHFPVLGESADKIAQWIGEMSGGRLKVKVYGGGELVPPLEAFDNVRALAHSVLTDYDRLDVLVNNAGFGSAPTSGSSHSPEGEVSTV